MHHNHLHAFFFAAACASGASYEVTASHSLPFMPGTDDATDVWYQASYTTPVQLHEIAFSGK